MKLKAIIFDLDGTLLNTLDDLAITVNQLLKKRNFPVHETEAFKMFIGDGVHNLIRRALPAEQKENDALVKEIVAEFAIIYSKQWHNKTKPYDGIIWLLQKLQEMEIVLNILSNKPDDFTGVMVDKYFPEIQFRIVSGEKSGIPRKPDPAAALLIAKEIGINPEEMMIIGDSAGDILTAKSAGMYATGVLWGYRKKEDFAKAGADFIVSTPEEILNILK